MALPDTTLENLETRRQDVAGFWWRQVFVTLLVLVVLAGVAGLFGVHSTTTKAEEDGWTLELVYAGTARAGLDVPFNVTVRHEGGLGKQVTLALTGNYLDIYETQGFHPEPSAESRDGDTLYLTFDTPPAGDTMQVSYDAYIQPAAQQGRDATLAIWADGHEVAPLEVQTRLMP